MIEVQGVIDLMHGATPVQEALLFQNPRDALQQAAVVSSVATTLLFHSVAKP